MKIALHYTSFLPWTFKIPHSVSHETYMQGYLKVNLWEIQDDNLRKYFMQILCKWPKTIIVKTQE